MSSYAFPQFVRITSCLFLLIAFNISYGQIFIDTGHPDAGKEVEEEVIVESELKNPDLVDEVSDGSNTGSASGGAAYDLPPDAKPGKCYARCSIPGQYEYVEEKVMDQPASVAIDVVPAVYKTTYDTVIVKEEEVISKTIPATYEYIEEQVMTAPPTTKWVKGDADVNCLSEDPKDCEVMCLVEVPAQYKTEKKKVLKTPEQIVAEVKPAEYQIVPKKVLMEPEKTVEREIPATYKIEKVKRITKPGGYQEWKEVLCSDQLTVARIQSIQKSLKEKGYYSGSIDNVFGEQTKSALVKFQENEGLPYGNLNLETLEALGVSYE